MNRRDHIRWSCPQSDCPRHQIFDRRHQVVAATTAEALSSNTGERPRQIATRSDRPEPLERLMSKRKR